jgi:DNA-binding GntR family transcriptional regulator
MASPPPVAPWAKTHRPAIAAAGIASPFDLPGNWNNVYQREQGLSGSKCERLLMPASADIVRKKRAERAEPPTLVAVDPLANAASLKRQAYTALKNAIAAMDVYRSRAEIRLDERRLAQEFGISRTPVREAMAQLEREGFVRSEPRRGVYVVRKSKREVIELITAWAALESMAARLITEHAGDREIASLRHMFATFDDGAVRAHLDEYSQLNIEFHQTIIRMSGNAALINLAENLFTHMRMIRRKTIGEKDRADRSIRDHMSIIEALEARDTLRAETLVRDHALGLAEHVAKYADYLD